MKNQKPSERIDIESTLDKFIKRSKELMEEREEHYKTLKPSELVRAYVNDMSWGNKIYSNDMERIEEEQELFNEKLLEILDEMQEKIDKLSE